jgi:ferredoxin
VWLARRAGEATEEEVMRIVVDYDLCESNAVCMGIAPEVFEVRDDDNLYILQEHPDESLRDKVTEAVRMCPKQALSIEED